MTLAETVEACKNLGITMKVVVREGELRLQYIDPYGCMDDDFLNTLRQHKGALIDIVQQQQVVVPNAR